MPSHHDANTRHRKVNEESVLAVQIFDQKKFKKKDQGFLGVINIRIGDLIPEVGPEADGMSQAALPPLFACPTTSSSLTLRTCQIK